MGLRDRESAVHQRAGPGFALRLPMGPVFSSVKYTALGDGFARRFGQPCGRACEAVWVSVKGILLHALPLDHLDPRAAGWGTSDIKSPPCTGGTRDTRGWCCQRRRGRELCDTRDS